MTLRDQVEKVPQEAKTVRRNATIGLQPFVTISDTEGSAVAIMGGALLCARFFVWFCS